MSRILAVIGATGQQGSGVVSAALKSGWKVRALSRNPNSEKAKALSAQGVQVVAADLNKPEDLEKAFTGVDAVFSVTNFYEIGEEGEYKQGVAAVNAAKKQNVKHFIYSSLPNAQKISGGKYHVPHFTTKSKVDDFMFASGLPSSAVQISCYFENFATMMAPRKNAEGVYEITVAIPKDSKFTLSSVEDVGNVSLAVLNDKEKFLGKTIPIVGEYLTPDEIAATFQKVWGVPVKANYVPPEIMATFPFPFADEVAWMFAYFHEFGYYGEKTNKDIDIWAGKKVYPGVQTLEQWLRASFPSPPSAPQTH